MLTSYYGGQGAPSYNEGAFTVKYTKHTKALGRWERKKRFNRYDVAKAFYDGIDDNAAIWDTTHHTTLCEAKNRIAYYEAALQHKKNTGQTRRVVTEAAEPEHALVLFHRQARGTDWMLLRDSWREITEAEFTRQALGQ